MMKSRIHYALVMLLASSAASADMPQPNPMTNAAIVRWSNCIAYYTVRVDDGSTPIPVLANKALGSCDAYWKRALDWSRREKASINSLNEAQVKQAGIRWVEDKVGGIILSMRSDR